MESSQQEHFVQLFTLFALREHNKLLNTEKPMSEDEHIERAVAAVKSTTGLNFSVMTPEMTSGALLPKEHRADAFLEIALSGRTRRLIAEYKSRVDRISVVLQVKAQLDAIRANNLPLLVTHHISPNMADQCREAGLNFIDTAGNCYLEDEGFFVLVKGNKPPEDAPARSVDYRGGTSYSALRLIFALIAKPELLGASYRELITVSGISLGSVGLILDDLESRGLVSQRDKKKQRRFLDLPRLREEWAANYAHKLKPRLKAQRFSIPEEVPEWWQRLTDMRGEFLWGGEVAAAKLDGHLKPVSVTLYTKRKWDKTAIARLVQEYRLRADTNGTIEIVESFWNFEDAYTARNLVPPLLIYADLLTLMDPRATEAAIGLKERHLDHA
jgi:hypothetical protein